MALPALLGAEPWETVWGQMATTVSNRLGLEHQRTAKGASWLRSRREETELQTHPRNKQRKPGWELCSKKGLGQTSGGTVWVVGL